MKTRQSSKCGRPPNEGVASQLASLDLRSNKTSRNFPVDEVVSEMNSVPTQESDRPTETWAPLKQRLHDTFGLLRAFLFIHMEDDRVWLRIRGFLQFRHRSVSCLALLWLRTHRGFSLPELLEDLNTCVPQSKSEGLKQQELQVVLSALLTVILSGDIKEFRPLFEKLSEERQLVMETLFGEEYRRELSEGGDLRKIPNFQSWFALRKREPRHHIHRSLSDLNMFQHARGWSADEGKHTAKCDAFVRHPTRAQEMPSLTVHKNVLTKDRKTQQEEKTWSDEHEQGYEEAMAEIKQESKTLKAEKKLIIRRTRKYRLFPTRAQRKALKQYMGTCRWTCNQAVAHHRKTNEFNAERLRDLYVTKKPKKTIEYPDGKSSPPEWAFDTPKTLQFNVLQTFQTNVKSALSNVKNGNVKQFKISFSTKKRSPSFTMSEDGEQAEIREDKSGFYLSFSKLKDIRVKMNSLVGISCEIDILNSNGFWYVAIPEYVEPMLFSNRDKCIALDHGTKAFMTGMDLEGNVLEFGRGTKTYLKAIRKRRDEAQSVMSKFKNEKGKRS